MNTNGENIIVLGSKKYKSSPNVELNYLTFLDNKTQEMEEYDRTVNLNLLQVYDDERQVSTNFRPAFNVGIAFFNAYTGTTSINGNNYEKFTNDLAYTDAINSIVSGTHPGSWYGYPKYKEFDFFRSDSENTHVSFVNKSAYTYNWGYYLSYAYANDTTKQLKHWFSPTDFITWTVSDGIPFIISRQEINGRTYLQFTCPMKHNLAEGDYVELEFPGGWNGVNSNKLFQVDVLGDPNYGTEEFIFNIYDIGYDSPQFANSQTGTFKRVVDITNPNDTKSIYYIRRNKIITNLEDAIPLKAGFSQNGFFSRKQFQTSALTPNFVSSVAEIDGSRNYNVTFSKDIDISKYVDNLNRPLSELYLTIVNKGYYGWFNKPRFPGGPDNSSLKQGWNFNISFTSGLWWDDTNLNNSSGIPTGNYTQNSNGNSYTFYYNQNLKDGDTMDGDFCEFNNYLQEEYVISEYYHKFEFNEDNFSITQIPSTNRNGYYYKPHNKMVIRVFSDYIEDSDTLNIIDVPNYAFYSESIGKLRWRDIYPFGYKDSDNRGVDYPFLNKSHYPFQNILFKIFPVGNINEYVLEIPIPTTDDCQ